MQRVEVVLELDLPFDATEEEIQEWVMLETGSGGASSENPLVAAGIDLQGDVVCSVAVRAW